MTQEEKVLLLKDLCARLPYGIIVTDNMHGNSVITEIDAISDTVYCSDFYEYVRIEKCVPYLRPIPSMTEKEKCEFNSYYNMFNNDPVGLIDWLNTHHFDYRGLIHKCIALEAPEDMYNINKK